MSKTFNVEEVQKARYLVAASMVGRKYRHYKGDDYTVVIVSVHEGTGEILVTYKSDKYDYVWTRTLANFTERVNDGSRFALVLD